MFTFVLVAEMSNRKSNIYNTILASAFCILVYNPNLLFSVSFQFSNLTVLGIVLLFKKIYNLLYVKNKLLDFFWQITALSFSVQLATFSINIFYFHQFPALFPITNLFAIPMAMTVVIGSLLIFFTSFLAPVSAFLGYILEKCVFFYNEIILFFSRLSITSIEDLSLKGKYVFLIILLVFFLVRFLELRRIYLFRIFTFLLVATSMVVFIDHKNRVQQEKVFIYSVKNKFYMDVFYGKTCYSNVNSISRIARKDIYYNILPNRKFNLITDVKSIYKLKTYSNIGKNKLFVLGNHIFLELSGPMNTLTSKDIVIDYLIVGKSGLPYLKNTLETTIVKNLVLDGTIKAHEKNQLKNNGSKEIIVHDTITDGPFVLSI